MIALYINSDETKYFCFLFSSLLILLKTPQCTLLWFWEGYHIGNTKPGLTINLY
jgi:hypothetical protein